MNKISNIFERIEYLAKQGGFKNIPKLSQALGYKSPQKIYRLKNVETKPSVDMIEDFSNMFELLNLRWFITGNGEPFIGEAKNEENATLNNGGMVGGKKGGIQKMKETPPSDLCPKCELNEEKLAYQAELISMLREKVRDKEEIISHLKDMLEMIQKGPDKGKNGHHSSKAS